MGTHAGYHMTVLSAECLVDVDYAVESAFTSLMTIRNPLQRRTSLRIRSLTCQQHVTPSDPYIQKDKFDLVLPLFPMLGPDTQTQILAISDVHVLRFDYIPQVRVGSSFTSRPVSYCSRLI